MLRETIKIVIPGTPMVKKNGSKVSAFIKNKKTGKLDQRDVPVHYYTKQYNEWAKKALPIVISLKNNLLASGWELPITDMVNLKCLFYFDANKVVDLSALYEAPQDLLTGRAGVYSETVPPDFYKILMDDSVRFIASHDGSRFLLDYVNPRTEIYIEAFRI